MGPLGNPDLADIVDDMDFDFEKKYFLDFLDPTFPDSWISRFLDLGTRFLAMAGCGSGGTSRRISAVSGRHSRTTEFMRSKE